MCGVRVGGTGVWSEGGRDRCVEVRVGGTGVWSEGGRDRGVK